MDAFPAATLPVKPRKVKGKVEINSQRCKACELCIRECKEGALSLGDALNTKGYRYVLADNDLCTGCVNCALICPDAVITVFRTGRKKSAPAAPDDLRERLQQTESVPLL